MKTRHEIKRMQSECVKLNEDQKLRLDQMDQKLNTMKKLVHEELQKMVKARSTSVLSPAHNSEDEETEFGDPKIPLFLSK